MENKTDYIIRRTVICNRCGKTNDIDNNFCSNCANKLKEQTNDFSNLSNISESDTANNIANYISKNNAHSNVFNNMSVNKVNNEVDDVFNNDISNKSNNNLGNIPNNIPNNVNDLHTNGQNVERQGVNESSEKFGVLSFFGILSLLTFHMIGIIALIILLIICLIDPSSKSYVFKLLKVIAGIYLSFILSVLILFGACAFLISVG